MIYRYRFSRPRSFQLLYIASLMIVLLGLDWAGAQRLEADTRVIAVSDGAPPADVGFSPHFTEPVINESGRAAFVGFLVEGEEFGEPHQQGKVLSGSGPDDLVEIASIGSTAFGGVFTELIVDGIDDTGRVAVRSRVGGLGERPSGYFLLSDGDSPFTVIAHDAQVLASGDSIDLEGYINMDNSGNAVFRGDIIKKETENRLNAVFRFTPNTGVNVAAHEDQVPPDGDGVFHSLFPTPAINDRGQFLFSPNIRVPGGAIEVGLFRSSESEAPTLLSRTGDLLPNGGAVASSRYSPAFNDAGQAAFHAEVSGSTDGFGDGSGVFLADGKTPIRTFVRAGQPSPDGDGNFSLFGRHSLNNQGQIVFGTVLEGTDNDVAIVRADAAGSLTVVARLGGSIPNSDTSFLLSGIKRTNPQGVVSVGFHRAASINDLGQVVFESEFANAASGEPAGTGIYFYDDDFGMLTVAKTGDPLLESTIAEVELGRKTHVESARADGVNNCGQVAYRFVLADGREGVAIWDPGFRKSAGRPRFVDISTDSSGQVVIQWSAPADLEQTIESSPSLEAGSWRESTIAPTNIEGESWRWQGAPSESEPRFFRIRW